MELASQGKSIKISQSPAKYRDGEGSPWSRKRRCVRERPGCHVLYIKAVEFDGAIGGVVAQEMF